MGLRLLLPPIPCRCQTLLAQTLRTQTLRHAFDATPRGVILPGIAGLLMRVMLQAEIPVILLQALRFILLSLLLLVMHELVLLLLL